MFGLDVESDGDHSCVERLDDLVKCLPPGQAGATASITGPGGKDDLATPQRGQTEGFTIERTKVRLSCDSSGQSVTTECRRTERTHSVFVIADDRHPEGMCCSLEVDTAIGRERAGGRNTQLSTAHSLGFCFPAGRIQEVRRAAGGLGDDHTPSLSFRTRVSGLETGAISVSGLPRRVRGDLRPGSPCGSGRLGTTG